MTSQPSTAFDVVDIQPGFVVVAKAAGIEFHSLNGQAGLVPQVEAQLQLGKLYPVHRLDTMTSGLILLARDAAAAELINRQFRQRRVQKYYLAISDRKPVKKQGLVSGDMHKARRGSWKLMKTQADPAQTRFFSMSLAAGLRLYLLKPLTGRTHQLRVMMKSLGAPILGDPRYYPKDTESESDRGYLHAYVLMFEYAGQNYRYCAEPKAGRLFCSPEFAALKSQIDQPENLNWPDKR